MSANVEYKTLRTSSHSAMEKELNKLAPGGWRMVGYQLNESGQHFAVLERTI